MTEIDITFKKITLAPMGRRPTNKNDVRALLQLCGKVAGNVVEIGAWEGKTTFELASRYTKKKFYTFDWLENTVSDREQAARSVPENLCMYAKDLLNVYYSYMPSYKINYAALDMVDMIFIDGDHSYAGVKADTEKALAFLAPQGRGIIAWHDARNGTFGVPHYLNNEIAPRYEIKIFKGSQVAYIDV